MTPKVCCTLKALKQALSKHVISCPFTGQGASHKSGQDAG